MPKALIAKQTLEHMALAEIRARAGREDVRSIEIDYVYDQKIDSNWKISVVKCGRDHNAPSPAVMYVHNKLRAQYNLRPDS